MKLKPSSKLPELELSVGEELLKVHVSYGPLVQKLLKKFNPTGQPKAIKGLAHITGWGFIDNIPRILPKKVDVVIRKGTWTVLPLFKVLQENGKVPDQEMHQVFNMGIGMVVFVPGDKADAVMRFLKQQGFSANIIGEVTRGTGLSRVV